jgi:hypothetical protein
VRVTEPRQPPAGDRPSEDEIREYVQQVRSAPADRVVSEVLFGLLNAAQAKLGRRDARLVIDLSAAVLDHSRKYLPAELIEQVDQVLGQLRLGQVQAESRLAASSEPEPNDLPEAPPAPGATADRQPPSPPTSGDSPARPAAAPRSEPPPKLWVPGRDF